MEGHCCANTFVSGSNGQPGFIKSAGIFLRKRLIIVEKSSCNLQSGWREQSMKIFNAQDDILETYWGHVFGFLKG